MQSIAASLPQEGEVSMTGECFKIRSGELPYLSPMLIYIVVCMTCVRSSVPSVHCVYVDLYE